MRKEYSIGRIFRPGVLNLWYAFRLGVLNTFQEVRRRPPFYTIHMLIYLKMGSRGYKIFYFLLIGVQHLKKIENLL